MIYQWDTVWIDFDVLIYRAAFNAMNSAFTEFIPEIDLALDEIRSELDYIIDTVDAKKVVTVVSGSKNFRKKLWPKYKAHRKPKPDLVKQLYSYMQTKVLKSPIYEDVLEADDLINILHDPKKDIVISIDKDFRQIIGDHWNPYKDLWFKVTPTEAYVYFMKQVMTGDASDGYKGIPGIGEKRANKLLRQWRENNEPLWENIVNLYESKGLTVDDAIRNARMAFIVDKEHWDPIKKEVKLWDPKVDSIKKEVF